jgi:hypothetical protein
MLLFSICIFKKLCYTMGVYILSRNLLKMTDAQTHLKSAIEQRDAIVQEIQELNTKVASKRELGLKVQGIIEYLEQTGVKLPEEAEAPAPVAEAPAEEAPAEVAE